MTETTDPSRMVLSAHDISLRLGEKTVIDHISIGIRPGTIQALVGPNGAGKTTLLRSLAGLVAPTTGHIELNGRPLKRYSPRDRAKSIGYLAQSGAIQWPMTVRRVVALGRLPHLAPWQAPTDADSRAIDRAMELCELSVLADRRVDTLSGGERMRAAIARVLATDPAVLLADEPTAGLDPRHQLQILRVLADRATAGASVVLVLHDLGLAARFCDRVTLMHDGSIVGDGDPSAVLTDDAIRLAYGVDVFRTAYAGSPVVVPWSIAADGSDGQGR